MPEKLCTYSRNLPRRGDSSAPGTGHPDLLPLHLGTVFSLFILLMRSPVRVTLSKSIQEQERQEREKKRRWGSVILSLQERVKVKEKEERAGRKEEDYQSLPLLFIELCGLLMISEEAEKDQAGTNVSVLACGCDGSCSLPETVSHDGSWIQALLIQQSRYRERSISIATTSK